MYIRAREKAFTTTNVKSGWRNTGLEPSSPILVLDKHRPAVASTPSPPRTPAEHASLDLNLLNSSSPDDTEVRKVTAFFKSELKKPGRLTSLAKRFGGRMVRVLETTWRECSAPSRACQARELLGSRKSRKKGKRVALQGKVRVQYA
jgi:hypothetical protein